MLEAVLPAAVTVTTALIAWWTTRRVAMDPDAPTLRQRWFHARTIAANTGAAAAVLLVAAAGKHALWYLPFLWLAHTAAVFPARRAVRRERWSLGRYLSWRLRLGVVLQTRSVLILLIPWIALEAGEAWPTVTACLALVAYARLAAPHSLVLRILGTRPLEEARYSGFLAIARRIAGRSEVGHHDTVMLPSKGGRWANALALASLRGRSVVLSETLLDELTAAEAAAIYAHELAHLERFTQRYIRLREAKLWAATTVALALVPAGRLLAWPATGWLPVVWMVVLFAASIPARSTGRRVELACDARAAELMGDPDTLASALERLHEINLLPRRFGREKESSLTHPSLRRRVEAVDPDRTGGSGDPGRTEPLALPAGRGRWVILDGDGITLLGGVREPAADQDALRRSARSVRRFPYEELAELSLVVRGRRPARLVWVTLAGVRRAVRLPAETEAAVLELLERVEDRIGGLKVHPFLLSFATSPRIVRILAFVGAAVGLLMPAPVVLGAVFLLAVFRPRVPQLASGAAVALASAAFRLVPPSAGWSGSGIEDHSIEMVMVGIGMVLALAACGRSRLFPGERERGTLLTAVAGVSYLVALGAGLAIAYGVGPGGPDVLTLHTIAGTPGLPLLGIVVTTLLLVVPGSRRRRRLAGAAAAVTFLVLWVGGPALDRLRLDPFAADFPGIETGPVRPQRIDSTTVKGFPKQLRLAPGGRIVGVGNWPNAAFPGAVRLSSWRIVRPDGEPPIEVEGRDLRFLDARRAVALGPGGGGFELHTLDGAWRLPLGRLSSPSLGLDPATGRWWVTDRPDTTDGSAPFLRLSGTVGTQEVVRTEWWPPGGHGSVVWTALGGGNAMARVIGGFGPPDLVLLASLFDVVVPEQLFLVDGPGAVFQGTTVSSPWCRPGVREAYCLASEGTWSTIWRVEAGEDTLVRTRLGSLPGTYAPKDITAWGRTGLFQTWKHGLFLFPAAAVPRGRVRQLVLDDDEMLVDAALAGPDLLGTLSITEGSCAVTLYRLPVPEEER